jgi:hypothetical protein
MMKEMHTNTGTRRSVLRIKFKDLLRIILKHFLQCKLLLKFWSFPYELVFNFIFLFIQITHDG